MGKNTALYHEHIAAGARMLDFAGWDMPLHYGSQIAEHQAVRRGAGLFDVSHMTVIDIAGDGAKAFLRRLLAGDVARLGEGRALYTTLLNEAGGILDDLIVYRLPGRYRLVVNAATRGRVLDWLRGHQTGNANRVASQVGRPVENESGASQRVDVDAPRAGDPVENRSGARRRVDVETGNDGRSGDRRVDHPRGESRRLAGVRIAERDLAILAVQGPGALDTFIRAGDLPAAASLARFNALLAGGWMIARTGYTGEDGVEILLPNDEAPALWQRLLAEGARPAGLAARDTLRLEAGLNLYGQDMDETTSPLVSNLGWTVHWAPAERNFVGRSALATERARGVASKLTGLTLTVRGVMRGGQRVRCEAGEGMVTSGLFSPTLGYSIALARLPVSASKTADVLIRGKPCPARIVRPPFVGRGRAV